MPKWKFQKTSRDQQGVSVVMLLSHETFFVRFQNMVIQLLHAVKILSSLKLAGCKIIFYVALTGRIYVGLLNITIKKYKQALFHKESTLL